MLTQEQRDNFRLALASYNACGSANVEYGETEELREAGRWVYSDFPRLIELSEAMASAREKVRNKWEREREEELSRLYPDGGEKIGCEEVEATKSRVKSREEAKNSVTSMT